VSDLKKYEEEFFEVDLRRYSIKLEVWRFQEGE